MNKETGKMIITGKDSLSRKIKWYIITFFCELIVLAGVGCAVPYVIILQNRLLGGILFLPCFWLAGKICFLIENHIGIAGLTQNPNRNHLVRVFPEWTPPWLRTENTKKKNSER